MAGIPGSGGGGGHGSVDEIPTACGRECNYYQQRFDLGRCKRTDHLFSDDDGSQVHLSQGLPRQCPFNKDSSVLFATITAEYAGGENGRITDKGQGRVDFLATIIMQCVKEERPSEMANIQYVMSSLGGPNDTIHHVRDAISTHEIPQRGTEVLGNRSEESLSNDYEEYDMASTVREMLESRLGGVVVAIVESKKELEELAGEYGIDPEQIKNSAFAARLFMAAKKSLPIELALEPSA
ncbi:hypothetical protein FWH58_01315 [Candidatus Saccharibacteria bacterium]|nr:hypothetical protein [Candidatus Saccharibacteria bacterium]